jgi:IS5 family transposase
VTAGQEADCSNYEALMEARDSDPAIMLGDKGYDSDPIRQDLRDRGTVPEIPTKRNRHVQHSVSRPLYALRSRIECFINRLKNSRRVATPDFNSAFRKIVSVEQVSAAFPAVCTTSSRKG